MDWRELYEEKDRHSDTVTDVWLRNGRFLAYEYRMKGSDRRFVCPTEEWLIKKLPPKRYSFMEAVALMEQGKKMRPVQWPKDTYAKYVCISNKLFKSPGGTEIWLHPVDIRSEWEEVPDGR